MIQGRWRDLERKFAPLGVTFEKEEFVQIRCLRCSQILIGGDSAFYCDSCLLTSDEGALEHLKIQEYLCLISKMILLGVLSSKEDCLLPNIDPEFNEYITECMKRYYELGIAKHIGFKNPDAINFFRFYVGNRN